jgi:soluble lytic murein transglycosylase-like protein
MLQPKAWRKSVIYCLILPALLATAFAVCGKKATAPENEAKAQEAAPISDISEPPSTVQQLAAIPTPEPSTMPVKEHDYTSGVNQWASLVSSYPWPVDEALAVMTCESGGDKSAVSSTGDYGLMQINWRWQGSRVAKMGGSLESLYDPAFNVKVAYAIYSEQGWRPWTCGRKLRLN